MKNFKELIIWQKGIQLVKSVYVLSKSFPGEEKFGMVSQVTRAAVSIPANIAEGSSRNSEKDYARFLQIALGSAFEVQTYLVIAKEMQWINNEKAEAVESLLEEEIKMMHSFIRKLGGN
ncbi:MAG TPA: four helix bundle protein [Hanamia sp.]|nr:four helix bundle protein [Hanamia sp.]